MSPFRPARDQDNGCTSLKSSAGALKNFLWFMDLTWSKGDRVKKHKPVLGNIDSGVTAKKSPAEPVKLSEDRIISPKALQS